MPPEDTGTGASQDDAGQTDDTTTTDNDTTTTDNQLGEKGERALNAWKSRARNAEAQVKELDDMRARLSQYEDAQKSESEKFLERLAKAERDRDDALRSVNTVMQQTAVFRAAAAAGAIDPEAVYALLPKGVVTVDKAGNVKGVEEALEAVQKDRPYLFPGSRPGAFDGGARDANGGRGSGTADMSRAMREALGMT